MILRKKNKQKTQPPTNQLTIQPKKQPKTLTSKLNKHKKPLHPKTPKKAPNPSTPSSSQGQLHSFISDTSSSSPPLQLPSGISTWRTQMSRFSLIQFLLIYAILEFANRKAFDFTQKRKTIVFLSTSALSSIE